MKTFAVILLAALGIIVVVSLVGAGAALGNSDTDLVNPQHASADADRIRADTTWQQQLNQMEYPYLAQERAAQSEAEVARLAAENNAYLAQLQENLRLQKEQHDRQLALQEALNWAIVAIVTVLGVGVSLVLIVILFILLNRWTSRIPDRQPRRAVPAQLRPQEQPGRPPVPSSSNGHHRPALSVN
jgi:hypothetical protein